MFTATEIWDLLSRGRKIRHKDWDSHKYIHIVEGELVDEEDNAYDGTFPIKGVELYCDPILHLGAEHVGKKVKLRNGTISVILEYDPSMLHSIRTVQNFHYSDGLTKGGQQHPLDIITVLD